MLIKGKTYDEERAFYGAKEIIAEECLFDGEADGESAFKEARNVKAYKCKFNLRYPFWHTKEFSIEESEFGITCRAPLWYSKEGKINNCTMYSPKALRECENMVITNTYAESAEFCWNCENVNFEKCELSGEYMFFGTKSLNLKEVKMKGKYSFQYTENVTIENCEFDTKDAFWHAKNVLIKDSVIKGEYIGWYCENVKFINCKLISTQPLCYCKGLELINCTMEQADRSFEYSEVKADIKGEIISVKNPLKGSIHADRIGEIITNDALYKCECSIKQG